MIDVDGNEDGVLFWCKILIESDNFLNCHQALILGDDGEYEREEALFDDKGVGEFLIDLCGFGGDKQILLYDFGKHFK